MKRLQNYRVNPARLREARCQPMTKGATDYLNLLRTLLTAWVELSGVPLPPGTSSEAVGEALLLFIEEGYFILDLQMRGDEFVRAHLTPTDLSNSDPSDVAKLLHSAFH
jgi:hypothetical protein